MKRHSALSIFALVQLVLATGGSPLMASSGLSLEAAVHEALASHPRVQAAHEAWRAAESTTQSLMPPSDPTLELEFEGMPSVFGVGDHQERSVGMTQRIALPLAWRHKLSAARLRADAVRLEAVGVAHREVAYAVAVAYLDVLLEKRLLAFGRRDLDVAQELADIARRRHELGDATPLVDLRADVEAGRTAVAVAERGDALSAARARLNALLPRPLDAVLELSDSLLAHETDIDQTQLQALALELRPEVLAAAARRRAADREERAMRAALLPALEVGLFRHDFSGAPAATWRLNLGVEVPLWAASRQRALASGAAAETRRRQQLEEDTRRRVALQVHTACLQLVSARRSLGLFESKLLRQAEAAHTTAHRGWEQGKSTQLDLLDARRTLTEVRMAHVRAVHAHEVARHNLERAVGTLFASPERTDP